MSGSSLAYHLRINKYIDRRLFVETLELVALYQSLDCHAYISMGGGYLEDFRVVHQAFGINRMLSFDLDNWVVQRQRLNRPYGFIRCEQAASEDIVDRFAEERDKLVGPEGNVIVWLDYTQPGKRYSQLEDFELLIGKLVPGDVFRITLNATRNTFGSNDQHILAKRAGKTEHTTLAGWWNGKLAEQLLDYLPPDRNGAEFMDTEADFAVTLARAVHRAALRGLPAHGEFILEPLLTVRYADGQQMLTLTGIVLHKDHRSEFYNRTRWGTWPYKPGADWDNCVNLSVPHLSAVERKIIHDSMYYNAWPNLAAQLDFKLDEREDRHESMVDQYLQHYLRYPIFAPIDSI